MLFRSGKTTLLNIMAALDKATNGEVILAGKSLTSIKDSKVGKSQELQMDFMSVDMSQCLRS